MSNKGKKLEKTVRLIQETLKDSVNTQIFSNYKIPNESGRKREIDVLIISKLNDFEIKIAIECKDFSRKIPVEKIEAFNSKCLRIADINKKVFVSSKGYQADAIEAANHFDIELMTAHEVTPDVVRRWLPISQLSLRLLPRFKDVVLYLDNDDEKYLKEVNSKFNKLLFQKNTSNSINIDSFLIESIKLNKEKLWVSALLEWMRLDDSKKMDAFFIPFRLHFKEMVIYSFDNKEITLLGLEAKINVQFLKKPALIRCGNSLQDASGDVKANTISLDIGSGHTGDVILDKNQKASFYLTNELGETEKMVVLLTYDPKTDTFSKGIGSKKP